MRYVSISIFSCFGRCQQLAGAGFIGLQRLKPPTPDGTFMSYKWRCKEKDEICLFLFIRFICTLFLDLSNFNFDMISFGEGMVHICLRNEKRVVICFANVFCNQKVKFICNKERKRKRKKARRDKGLGRPGIDAAAH